MLSLRVGQRVDRIVDVVSVERVVVVVALKRSPLDQNRYAIDIFLPAGFRALVAACRVDPRILVDCVSHAAAAADGVVLDTNPRDHAERLLSQKHPIAIPAPCTIIAIAPGTLASREDQRRRKRHAGREHEPYVASSHFYSLVLA
jgi:hypothetical protein